MEFVWIGQVRPQNSLPIGIDDGELPHITELVQHIRKWDPARSTPAPFDIRDCIRAFLGRGELRDPGRVCVIAEERSQLIRRVGSQLG